MPSSFGFIESVKLKKVIFLYSLSKILKCANNDDIITLKAADQDPDTCSLILESKGGEKTSDFVVNLVRIDADQLGIPVSYLFNISTNLIATCSIPRNLFKYRKTSE